MGVVVNAEFGNTEDEVLLWSDFNSKVTVWNLNSGRTVEIKDPKFPKKSGWAYRPGNAPNSIGVFSLLSRPAATDVITLHAPLSYRVLRTINLETADARGFKWSHDGKWIAVWDTASVGVYIAIYSADGHLFRTYRGDPEIEHLELGVRTLEWSPRGDFLAVAGHDRRIVLLSTRTFSPMVYFDHTPTIQLNRGTVWQEVVPSGNAPRTYEQAAQPVSPSSTSPSTANVPSSVCMITHLSFSPDGRYLATTINAHSTTLWLWDLTLLAPHTVIINHEPIYPAPTWEPTHPALLLARSAFDHPHLYLYNATQANTSHPDPMPRVLKVPFERQKGRLVECWLLSTAARCSHTAMHTAAKPSFLYSDSSSTVLVHPYGAPEPLPPTAQSPELNQTHAELSSGSDNADVDGDTSSDSLADILSGRKPIPNTARDSVTSRLESEAAEDDDLTEEEMEDTFRGKFVAPSRTEDGLVEDQRLTDSMMSGIDEMF